MTQLLQDSSSVQCDQVAEVKMRTLTWFQYFMIQIVKTGKIPKSVAIIMDGNRRYAVAQKKEKHEGHADGLAKLEEAILWCKHLGIFELTVFALSKENLQRSPVEVDTLMRLCKDNFARLARPGGIFHSEKIKIRILGDLSLLPSDVAESLRQTEQITKNHELGILNVCICYNGSDEITQALLTNPTSKQEFESKLLGGYNVKPEILIRTSNEVRLSGFLLYQTNESYMAFVPSMWPDFSLWNFMKIIFNYQSTINSV